MIFVQAQAVLSSYGLASEVRNLMAGALAGGVAATAVTPADVIKTRLQVASGGSDDGVSGAHRQRLGSWSIARPVLTEHGVLGLFRGIGPRLARIPLYTAVTLATFELLKDIFLASMMALK